MEHILETMTWKLTIHSQILITSQRLNRVRMRINQRNNFHPVLTHNLWLQNRAWVTVLPVETAAIIGLRNSIRVLSNDTKSQALNSPTTIDNDDATTPSLENLPTMVSECPVESAVKNRDDLAHVKPSRPPSTTSTTGTPGINHKLYSPQRASMIVF